MIKLIELNTKKHEPVYELTINYMIGDASGDWNLTMEINPNNSEVIETFCRILDKLYDDNGGVSFDEDISEQEKDLTNDEILTFNLLSDKYYKIKKSEKDNELCEKYKNYRGFFGKIIDTEIGDGHGYLTFEGYDLYYFDKNGVKFGTKFEN